MILNFINVEDLQGQCLRIRCSDFRVTGMAEFELSKYAVAPLDRVQERLIWIEYMEKFYEIYAQAEFDSVQAEISKQMYDFVSIQYDPETGEITLKENQCPTRSTVRNISTQPSFSKPTTSKKVKPSSKSKLSRK